ncbi:MAG: glycosyltransferase family 4 protein [Thermomicrobiales bacterium]|nr:glycosyltransferase family 4 protein [Thermomicrobiales bacterium]MCO5219219.1 glycosyltransferase family 4 protein [Thermomicrobiales bacterium]MCO5225062.1 glycosyltransferase family 4 protein [Thermomicrobiales bacterium]MCO5228114.1 glycosyltransferase family 4 protein [Thermomicrobiales bacterium]
MKKQITHLSNVHPADDTRIFHKECTSLAKAGYAVTLIARKPRAQIFAGGVRIVEHHPPTPRLLRMTVGSFGLLKLALNNPSDLYHFHDPELIPVGFILKLLGKRVVYDVHEDIPAQLLTKPWLPAVVRPIASRMIQGVNWVSNRVFDGIVVARADAAEDFHGTNVVLVQNYALLSEFAALQAPGTRSIPDPNKVIYFGGVTVHRGLRQMISAIEILSRRREITLALVGPLQPPSLIQEIDASPARAHIDYQPWASREEMPSILSSASVGLVFFQPIPNHVTSYPNKLFEYMAAGLPIIGSDFPYWKQFIDDIDSGIRVNPTDSEAIADAIENLLDNPEKTREMGEAGMRAVHERFNWDSEFRILLGLVESLIGSA